MKILLCHNLYQQPGGEDRVFEDEGSLLEMYGHEVVRFTMRNDSIEEISKIQLVAKTFWNSEAAKQLGDIIRHERPQVMHCTNTFPLISPAAYQVAKDNGLGVVQSIHNYRMLCPKAQFVRDGQVCEKCLGKTFAWPAIYHGCYKGSRSATTVVAAMTAYHRSRKTWDRLVDCFIAPTQFVKDKHVEAGFDAEKIVVKPNFVFPDPGTGSGAGNYAAFAGRLSPEKGVDTLLETWQHINRDIPLKIAGDGPLAAKVQQAANSDSRIEWLGQIDKEQVTQILGNATCLIMPSVCYETFGLTIVEAFAKGTPVIASNMGAMAELIRDGKNGFLVKPGDARQLANKVELMFTQRAAQFRRAARNEYDQKYTAEANHVWLNDIYASTLLPEVPPAGPMPAQLDSPMPRQING
ncbi:MAG: glycosyltransferase [Rubripirellula sp.]|nr:glycosyltransferase [Rubripirellula sp.]